MQTAQTHTLTIEGRSRAFITGVEDVDCFNEEVAVITTGMGAVTITGAGLKVSQLDLAQGNVALEGRIDALEYGTVKRGGFFSRVFK
jgi:sporulation protein YabP